MNIKWKAAAFVSAVLLGTCLVSATCMAAESDTITQDGGSASKSVYAAYESAGEEGDVSQPVTDGTGSVTLPDGTTVTVSGVEMEGLYLKIYPITEETDSGEPWKWFSGLFQGKGTDMQPYDIWFEDAYGQVQEITDTVLISISPAGTDYKNPVVYYQPVSGDPVDMGASFANGTVSFYTNHIGYYVLLEQTTENTSTETPTDTTGADEEDEDSAHNISGTLTDGNGNPIEGATVDIGGHTGVTDENGNFTIENVPDGSYTITITDKNGDAIGSAEVEFTTGTTGVVKNENGSYTVSSPQNAALSLDLTVTSDGSIVINSVTEITADESEENASEDSTESSEGSSGSTEGETEGSTESSGSASGSSGSTEESPQTGDTSNPGMWLGVLSVSLIFLVFLFAESLWKKGREGQ